MRPPPEPPAEDLVRFTDTPRGRMRSRTLGEPTDAPEAVSLAGSPDTPKPLDVPGHADAVAHWLDAAGLPPVVLIGHSSGTQVAAHAALLRPDRVAGLVLASPTVDPAYRTWPRVLLRWRLDSRFPTPGLEESHPPEWKRAGLRRIHQLVSAHLRDRLETVLPRITCPVLVIRGDHDRMLTASWARELAEGAIEGHLAVLPGPHTFLWHDPASWSEPIKRLATRSVLR